MLADAKHSFRREVRKWQNLCGQTTTALDGIIPSFPQGVEVVRFAYHGYADPGSVLGALGQLHQLPEIVVGWSLGGKIAVLATATGVLRPKLLVQLSTAFKLPPGCGLDAASGGKPGSFYEAFKAAPQHTRKMLAAAMVQGDSFAEAQQLQLTQDTEHDEDWLRWIRQAAIVFDQVDFSRMPRTVIVHGSNDAVVPAAQSAMYQKKILNCRVELLPECGHLPQMHAPTLIASIIADEFKRESVTCN
jgi:pimeloyl-ACP methyl ester carboxylesterase